MDPQQTKQLTFGLVVTCIGLMLLATQLNLGWTLHMGRLWPAVFLVLAAGQFASSNPDGWRSGVWFLFLAGMFFMHTLHVLRLSDSWPLFVVAGGVSLMFPKGPGCGPDRPGSTTTAGLTTGRGQA